MYQRRRGRHTISEILAAAVVGIHGQAIAVFVCHESEFGSGSIVNHGVVLAADGERIHAFELASLRLCRGSTYVLTRALVGRRATNGKRPASNRVNGSAGRFGEHLSSSGGDKVVVVLHFQLVEGNHC